MGAEVIRYSPRCWDKKALHSFTLTSELEYGDDVHDELDEKVEGGGGARRTTHVPDQLGQTELPLGVTLGLNPLVGVGHHSNQEVDEHHHRHHLVDPEHNLARNERPVSKGNALDTG